MKKAPCVLSEDDVSWIRDRSKRKDPLHLEVIDWQALIASHELLRAEVHRLKAAEKDTRANLYGRV